ncbi:alpha/beta hydrolase [Winogradskya consettensis]|uniref:Hydrolase n=1 Tax=Winogradskya consettensis TaxID=113560 RepID=A0A919SA42_9ACTN|nr:alpha/beta hydrolase [Actinoplanes consettensis]GIM67982.1 hydrolase [Actinoplanes consettensis]
MRNTAITLGVVVFLAAIALVTLKTVNDRYTDPGQAEVTAAGYVEKTIRVNEVALSYVEGPDNGPPLVLLHAQHLDWYSYNLVLPGLARSFHVFDIDYPGHGATTVPAGYPMTAERIGTDLGDFIRTVIKEPAYVTGNSSGGLLATWLAANRPELVRAALLEDPPLFSAEQPRIQQTIAYKSFVTSNQAVQDHADDFLLYWIRASKPFFDKNVGRGSGAVLTRAITSYRGANPGAPVEIGLLRNDTVRQFVRGLDEYDPRFGAAFYDGTFNQNFDHAAALEKITCPVLLLQANFEVRPDGILDGAMSQEEASRAASLLRNGTYRRVDATHVVHLDEPAEFTELLTGFFLRNTGS